MTHTVVGLNPTQTIDIVSNHTLYREHIDTLYVTPQYVFAANGSGVQRVFPKTSRADWPAWLVETLPEDGQGMQRINNIDEIKVGMVILTGTAYYLVGLVGPRKFRGYEWENGGWGKMRDVPFPSPTYDAHSVSPDLFNPLP